MADETSRVLTGIIIPDAIVFTQIDIETDKVHGSIWDQQGGDKGHNNRALRIIGPDGKEYRIPVILVGSSDSSFYVKGCDGGYY